MISEKLQPVTTKSPSEAKVNSTNEAYDTFSAKHSALSYGMREKAIASNALPPSSVRTGTRFTSESVRLVTAKKSEYISRNNRKASNAAPAAARPAAGPARAAAASLAYGSFSASERMTAPNGSTVIPYIFAPHAFKHTRCPTS